MTPEALLNRLCDAYEAALGNNFAGMYVHGSYAMGCFNPKKSDLDYILVCRDEPADEVKRRILDATAAGTAFAPAKGLEMHLMRLEDCRVYRHPPYFALHYSPAHEAAYAADPTGYIARMKGHDPDLAAHLTVMADRGLCWRGLPVARVFGAVPRDAYLQSILEDAGWSEGDCMYHVLNRCRILAYRTDGQVLSKKEGALWALTHLEEELLPPVWEAFACYEGDQEMAATAQAEAFCTETLRRIRDMR